MVFNPDFQKGKSTWELEVNKTKIGGENKVTKDSFDLEILSVEKDSIVGKIVLTKRFLENVAGFTSDLSPEWATEKIPTFYFKTDRKIQNLYCKDCQTFSEFYNKYYSLFYSKMGNSDNKRLRS
jgi:hypothetical protein